MEKNHGTEKEYLPWLITNTKVTSEVFDYGNCNDLRITAWYNPEGAGLRDMIIKSKLHPVTLLYYLSPHKMTELLNENLVTLCNLRDAIKVDKVSHILSENEIKRISDDIRYLHQDE
jgi:hypothetical protein